MHKRLDPMEKSATAFIVEAAAEDNLFTHLSWPAKLRRRAGVRRWLIVTAAVFFFALYLMGELPFLWALAGTAVMAGAAALLPREKLVRVMRLSPAIHTQEAAGGDVAARIIEGVPEPVLLLEASGNIVAFNRKTAEQFPSLKAGRHISSIIRGPQVLAAVNQAAKGDGALTVRYIERVPVEHQIAATVTALNLDRPRRQPGTPEIMIFLRDLTAEVRLDEMRSDFVANASHELKTPLASLIGFIETLQGPARDDEQARDRFLNIMLKQTRRMSRLVENLLSLSRVEMRSHLRPASPVDLAEVVRNSVQALEPLARASNIALEVEADGEFLVPGDRDELVQVLHNLVHNGIKYGRHGGHVRISIERMQDPLSGGKIALKVTDDGPGIAAQHLPRLTERFYRASGAGEAGAGLGLTIVDEVVKRHRGEMRIESELGKGAAFLVILPEAAS